MVRVFVQLFICLGWLGDSSSFSVINSSRILPWRVRGSKSSQLLYSPQDFYSPQIKQKAPGLTTCDYRIMMGWIPNHPRRIKARINPFDIGSANFADSISKWSGYVRLPQVVRIIVRFISGLFLFPYLHAWGSSCTATCMAVALGSNPNQSQGLSPFHFLLHFFSKFWYLL